MKALMGGCWTPDLVTGSLHSTSADLTRMFMAKEKRVTKMVDMVIISLLNSVLLRCDAHGSEPQIEIVIVIHDEVLDVALDIISRAASTSLWGMEPYAFAKSPHYAAMSTFP